MHNGPFCQIHIVKLTPKMIIVCESIVKYVCQACHKHYIYHLNMILYQWQCNLIFLYRFSESNPPQLQIRLSMMMWVDGV